MSKSAIYIGDKLCGKIPEIPSGRNGKWYTLECKSALIGDSIRVETTRDDFLHFTQIEVYGMKKQILSKPKGASKFVAMSAGEEYGNYA